MLYPAPYGALTPLFAGTMPEALAYNGEVRPGVLRRRYPASHVESIMDVQFMIPWARLGKCRPEVYDDEVGNRLWSWLEEEVKAFEASQASTM